MNGIRPDMRVRWQDGKVQRVGWVSMLFASGKAFVQDEDMYAYEVEVAKLVDASYTEEEWVVIRALDSL